MTDAPSLGQLIWLVRRELEWAREVDADHPLRFDVDAVELEASLQVTRSHGAGGGLDLTVFGLGAKADVSGDRSRGTTAMVKVTLTPSRAGAGAGKYSVSAVDVEPPPRRADAAPR